jgi:hypothetical protein
MSPSDDGNFFARGSAYTLKEEGQLRLLSAFADQAESPTGQMPNQQEPFEALRRSAPGFAQSWAPSLILGVPERLLNGHSLGIERNDGRPDSEAPSRANRPTAKVLFRVGLFDEYVHAKPGASPELLPWPRRTNL